MSLAFSSDPRLEFSPVSRTLIAVNIGVFVLGWICAMFKVEPLSTNTLLNVFGLFPTRILAQGYVWTPFTYMFLHANLVHIGVNMMGLYLLGPDLEQAFGRWKFLLLYLMCGLIGGLGFLGVSFMLLGQITPVVGASGAIMGLLGAIVAIYPERIYVILPLFIPLRATVLAVLLLTSHLFFMATPYGGRVAYDVHLMGGLTGYLFSAVLAWRHRRRWKWELPDPEIPYACVELESLIHKQAVAADVENALTEVERERYTLLVDALRYEDVPSLEEVSAARR